MKLAVELAAARTSTRARGNLVTYHVGNSRTLVGRDVGDTALHIATADKYPTVIEFLVSKGAKTGHQGPARAHAAGHREVAWTAVHHRRRQRREDRRREDRNRAGRAGSPGVVRRALSVRLSRLTEGSMRARLLTISLCATVLLALPTQANEKPTPEYQKAMKELGAVNNRLRNSLKDIDFRRDRKGRRGDEGDLRRGADVLAGQESRRCDQACAGRSEGGHGSRDAAKAQNHPGVVAAQAAIAGASSSGEIGAIGVCAPCHTAHRVRLPDGTYEIK